MGSLPGVHSITYVPYRCHPDVCSYFEGFLSFLCWNDRVIGRRGAGEQASKRENKTERELLSTSSLPKYLQQPDISQAKAGAQNFILVSHVGGKDPSTWVSPATFQGAQAGSEISRQVELELML